MILQICFKWEFGRHFLRRIERSQKLESRPKRNCRCRPLSKGREVLKVWYPNEMDVDAFCGIYLKSWAQSFHPRLGHAIKEDFVVHFCSELQRFFYVIWKMKLRNKYGNEFKFILGCILKFKKAFDAFFVQLPFLSRFVDIPVMLTSVAVFHTPYFLTRINTVGIMTMHLINVKVALHDGAMEFINGFQQKLYNQSTQVFVSHQ